MQPLNPWFYLHFYDSLEEETTSEYVFGELVYASGWIFAASVHAYRTGLHTSPFKIFTDGVSIMRYVAADAGLFSLPVTLPVVATAAALGWAATAEHHGAVTPGVASGFGMPMSPELYSRGTSSDPLGIRRDLIDMFGLN